jgi:ribosome-binding factor A
MPGRRYPRAARVNEVLREVIAEEVERLADADDRLGLLTVTAVQAEPDLRRAVVLLASMEGEAGDALDQARVRLQAAIADQVRLKRTPQLSFAVDPAVSTGQRVEDIIRALHTATREAATREAATREAATGEAATGEAGEQPVDPAGADERQERHERG